MFKSNPSKEWWMKMAELEGDSEVGAGYVAPTKAVIILSGISGSGKSEYARKIKALNPNAVIVSADQYFTAADGSYHFDHSKLGEAHSNCRRQFKQALETSVPLIIVDNTNTTDKEIRAYSNVGTQFGYDIQVVTLTCDIDTAVARNRHNVPEEIIRRQQDNLTRRVTPISTPGE